MYRQQELTHLMTQLRWRLKSAVMFASAAAALFTLGMLAGAYPVTDSVDWVLYHQPNLDFLMKVIRDGGFPWWNPFVGLGRPYASDLQNAVYYPFTYLFLFGNTVGLGLFLGAHSFVLIMGMHLLCRQLGARGIYGLLGGCALLVSMGVGGRLLVGHVFYFAGWCYLPMLLWVTVRLRVRPSLRETGCLAVLLALQFLTGHPQVFWLSIFGLGLFSVGLLARPESLNCWRRVPITLGAWVGALLLAGGVSAIGWLPFLDLIAEGNRQGATMNFASHGAFELPDLFGFVTEPPMDYVIGWEQNFRLGFAWTLPGLFGLCFFRRVGIRSLLLMGAVGLGFSFGETSWLFRQCYDWLPGASSFRLPSRINVLPLTALTAAAAVFLSRSRSLPGWPKAWWLIVAGIGVSLLRTYPCEGTVVKLGLFRPMLALLAAAGSLYVWKCGGRWSSSNRAIAILVWIGLQGVELSEAHSHFRRNYSFAVVTESQAAFPTIDTLKTTFSPAPSEVPIRIMAPPHLVPPNFAMREGWSQVDAYTSLFLNRPWKYLHAAAAVKPSPIQNTSLASKTYLTGPFSLPNLSVDVGLHHNSGPLITNPAPLPKMWVSFQPRLVSGPEEALAAATNRLNLPLESIIETPLPFPPAPAQAVGSASIVRFRHSEIEIKCLLSHAALLVLNEAWFPGWHAVFGGQRIESQPVNYWMRGFALPAGEHHVKLLFQPRRQTLALWLTTGSLAACWGLLSSRRRLSCRAGTSARTGLENQGKS